MKNSIHFISQVIPFYNEAENARPVIQTSLGELRSHGVPFEIIAVDDGSKDRTWQELESLQKHSPELKLVRLRTNFGQTRALAAGIKQAQGDWILTMDGDGQNDPADLPKLISKAQEGYDVVSGWRKNRKDNSLTRTLPSRIANWILALITGLSLHDSGCSLKLYRASALGSISLYSERHRFIPFLLSLKGFRIAEIEVNHRPRVRGNSKYGLSRTFKVFLDLIALALFARFREEPRIYFFLAAAPFMFFAVLTALQGGMTYYGASFLYAFGAFTLVSCGLMAEWLFHFSRERNYAG
ncbi:MAG: glycosyltransferase family 2 protein [Candidatus Omnitrophota bacterium]|nr:glycosyltransferase family 2 protein [Candidatus Omnitrophota bacterium]